MKLIQVNAWLGRLNGPLARFIESEAPDIVCLQEGLQPQGSNLFSFNDQYCFLEELWQAGNFSDCFFAPVWGWEMGGTNIDVGNAILSKQPIKDKLAFHVNNEYYLASQTDYRPNTRVFQSAAIVLNGKSLTVANHQGYLSGKDSGGDEVSVEKMKIVAAALKDLPQPLIFCGDLNVAPNSPSIQVLNELGLRNLTAEYGIKTTLSEAHRAPDEDRYSVACDYIFVSNEVTVKGFRVSDEIVSDHKALILDFEL